jgi:Txe/YoeB family toxin of Txe-Axe toxin-antitoxin module
MIELKIEDYNKLVDLMPNYYISRIKNNKFWVKIMIDEIKHVDYYSNSEQILVKKINEIIEIINKMRNDIDELMHDLFYRETINMEKDE